VRGNRRVAAAALLCALGSATTLADADADASPPTFDARALASYLRAGNASMTGALQVTVEGQAAPVPAVNARVVAIPDSAYTRWWIAHVDAVATQGSSLAGADADDKKLIRFEHVGTTDDDGSFRFDGLPAGSYRVRGRLEAHFDHTTSRPQKMSQAALDGSTVTTTEYVSTTVRDRSYFWLESGLVRLRAGDVRAIAMHVAARRNVYGRRSP
jgi:hypothetical protein